jgi:hypothetical protein
MLTCYRPTMEWNGSGAFRCPSGVACSRTVVTIPCIREVGRFFECKSLLLHVAHRDFQSNGTPVGLYSCEINNTGFGVTRRNNGRYIGTGTSIGTAV